METNTLKLSKAVYESFSKEYRDRYELHPSDNHIDIISRQDQNIQELFARAYDSQQYRKGVSFVIYRNRDNELDKIIKDGAQLAGYRIKRVLEQNGKIGRTEYFLEFSKIYYLFLSSFKK